MPNRQLIAYIQTGLLNTMGLGGDKAHEAGIKTLIDSIENGDAKLYADLAWVDWDNPAKPHIVEVVDKLLHSSKGDKTERLLFGTDAPLGVFGEKALKQGVKDNRVHIGLWANINNYLKTRRKKNGKVTTYYLSLQKLAY